MAKQVLGTINDPLDLAIVGGGIGGLYTGWRYLSANPSDAVSIFEGSDHVGGRLLSVTPPGIDDMVAELGGMRILPPNIQPLINALVDELNSNGTVPQIDTYPFPVNGPTPPTSDNIVYTRGTYFNWGDITTDYSVIPYKLEPNEQDVSLAEIIGNAIQATFPDIYNAPTPAARRAAAQAATYNGQPLNQQGFWNVLTELISYEAYDFEIDAGGYQTTLSNWNAADAIPWYLNDFGPDATYSGFSQGYRQVAVNVATLFSNMGGSIACSKKLVDFVPANGLITLFFADGSTTITRALVLAMPQRSLELLSDINTFLKRPAVRSLVNSVTPAPAFKLFATYPTPWWQSQNLMQGRSLTSLPIRQVYYWTNAQGQPVGPNDPAMLMSSYDDGTNASYWGGFRDVSGARWRSQGIVPAPVETTEAGGWQDNPPQWNDYLAVPSLINVMTDQLAILHQQSPDDITPVSVSHIDWADDPYGGGWNLWNIGVSSPDVMAQIVQPDTSQSIYICGEAYSNWQGWVEGALETADMVLAKLLPATPIVVEAWGGYRSIFINTHVQIQLEAQGGVPGEPYLWSIASGSLPPNWSLSDLGLITGYANYMGWFTCNVVASQASTGQTSQPAAIGFWIHYPL